ncbi:unnamed protein product, partial [Staurois parvus]
VCTSVPPHQCQPSVLPSSATHQFRQSVPSSATSQCHHSVPPISAAYQCCLSMPISATYLCHLISATYQCPSVAPNSSHQCSLINDINEGEKLPVCKIL